MALPVEDAETVGNLEVGHRLDGPAQDLMIKHVKKLFTSIRTVEVMKDCGQPERKMKDCYAEYMECARMSLIRSCAPAMKNCLKANKEIKKMRAAGAFKPCKKGPKSCSAWTTDKKMYTCKTAPKCCPGHEAKGIGASVVQCVPKSWGTKNYKVVCGAKAAKEPRKEFCCTEGPGGKAYTFYKDGPKATANFNKAKYANNAAGAQEYCLSWSKNRGKKAAQVFFNGKCGTRPLTKAPTNRPTKSPTRSPTHRPTKSPTRSPTRPPTKRPTRSPTQAPTSSPTLPKTTIVAHFNKGCSAAKRTGACKRYGCKVEHSCNNFSCGAGKHQKDHGWCEKDSTHTKVRACFVDRCWKKNGKKCGSWGTTSSINSWMNVRCKIVHNYIPGIKYVGSLSNPGAHPYVYPSRSSAAAACRKSGYKGLCSSQQVNGFQVCGAGWMSNYKGYWMSKTVRGCGSGRGFRSWGAGSVGAYCCGAIKYIGSLTNRNAHPYVYPSRSSATKACHKSGYEGLCSKAMVDGYERCAAGWMSNYKGYWMSKTVRGCGSGRGMRGWGAGNVGAYCCTTK